MDLRAVQERHELATEIGRKFNTDPLDENDMAVLFACASDIPELLRYIEQLEDRLLCRER